MYFKLDKDKNVIPTTLEEMAEMREYEKPHVRYTTIKKYNVEISTVFLGLDHGFSVRGNGHTPVVFETMIFWTQDQHLDQYQQRYCLWSQALEGHRETVRMVIKTIREQLKENPSRIYHPQKNPQQKWDDLMESFEKLITIETTEGSPIHEFVQEAHFILERYKARKGKSDER